jgi:hypothetical protein
MGIFLQKVISELETKGIKSLVHAQDIMDVFNTVSEGLEYELTEDIRDIAQLYFSISLSDLVAYTKFEVGGEEEQKVTDFLKGGSFYRPGLNIVIDIIKVNQGFLGETPEAEQFNSWLLRTCLWFKVYGGWEDKIFSNDSSAIFMNLLQTSESLFGLLSYQSIEQEIASTP